MVCVHRRIVQECRRLLNPRKKVLAESHKAIAECDSTSSSFIPLTLFCHIVVSLMSLAANRSAF